MSHRNWRETKQQPSMLSGCYLVSFHFLCNIHSIHSVKCILLYVCLNDLATLPPRCPKERDGFDGVLAGERQGRQSDYCLLPTYCLLMTYLLLTYDLLTAYLLITYCLLIDYSLLTYDLLTANLLITYYLLTAYLLITYCLLTAYTRGSRLWWRGTSSRTSDASFRSGGKVSYSVNSDIVY